jgi:predicted O-methyltransferase YrrM
MSRFTNYFKDVALRLINLSTFKNDFLRLLPEEYQQAANLVYFNRLQFTAEERKIGREVESFRSRIPEIYGGSGIESYTSPHSNTFKLKEGSAHANPGNLNVSKIEDTMRTGSNIYKGILLRRILAGSRVTRVLELGTNTGFSGCYFLSLQGVELVTVEGSGSLCEIARKNLSRISDNFRIMNCLFDEAIEKLASENLKFDCVFIDGQHEREATLHYTKRVMPLMTEEAIYVFDDIYWSDDMNQAWKELNFNFKFSESVDLFTVGVLRRRIGCDGITRHDIGDYLPRPRIFRQSW